MGAPLGKRARRRKSGRIPKAVSRLHTPGDKAKRPTPPSSAINFPVEQRHKRTWHGAAQISVLCTLQRDQS